MSIRRYAIDISLSDEFELSGEYSGEVDYINTNIEYCSLFFNMNTNNSFNDLIKDKELFSYLVNNYLLEKRYKIDLNDEYEDEESKEYYELLDKEVLCTHEEFINSDYSIVIHGSKENIVYFLNNNDIKRKVIISGIDGYSFSINDDVFINYLYQNLNRLDNVYIDGEGNHEKVSIHSYKYTIDYIDSIAKRVLKHNFSPLEKTMYIYDIVRDRKYNEEEKSEKATVSRDLSSIITGNNIVCVGFAELFDKICKKVGLYSCVDILVPIAVNKYGHARNTVFIDDKKYNIKGVYFFDPTYESKKDESDSHFNSYIFFAKKYRFFDFYDNYKKPALESRFSKMFDIIEDVYKNNRNFSASDIMSINSQCNRLTGKPLITVLERNELFINTCKNEDTLEDNINDKYRKKVIDFLKLLSTDIPVEILIKTLINVRIQEYYENPIKFPLTRKKIYDITNKSFKQTNKKEEMLLRCIFGVKTYTPAEIMRKEKLNKQIEGVRLSKTLRLVLEKKKSESE